MFEEPQWEPTPELRIFGVAERLEQRWRKPTFNSWGHLNGWEYEWRGVKHVYSDAPSSLP